MPTWLPILQGSDEDKLRAYSDSAKRAVLRAEVDAPLGPDSTFSKRWDLMIIEEPKLAKNRGLAGKHIAEIAKAKGQHPLDAFLDLAVEENLETVFTLGEINMISSRLESGKNCCCTAPIPTTPRTSDAIVAAIVFQRCSTHQATRARKRT